MKSGQIGKLFDFRACRINEIFLYQLLQTDSTVYVAVLSTLNVLFVVNMFTVTYVDLN